MTRRHFLPLFVLAGCMGCQSQYLRTANQDLERENFQLEQRVDQLTWELADAKAALQAYQNGARGPLVPATPVVAPRSRADDSSRRPSPRPVAAAIKAPRALSCPTKGPALPALVAASRSPASRARRSSARQTPTCRKANCPSRRCHRWKRSCRPTRTGVNRRAMMRRRIDTKRRTTAGTRPRDKQGWFRALPPSRFLRCSSIPG